MLCTYCNASRPPTDVPCPQCGAPSPLLGGTMGASSALLQGSWGGTPRNTSGLQWNNQPSTGPLRGTAANNNFPWAPGASLPSMPAQPPMQGPSLLPVPYQDRAAAANQSLLLMSQDPSLMETALLPIPTYDLGPLAPYPGIEEGDSLHIPAMYTKPRAVIPTYRIISGLLSTLIIFALLCTGAGYYAKVTGKITFLQRFFSDVRPQNISAATAHSLPDPPMFPTYGPAKNIINSASTAAKIDLQTGIALQPTNIFTPGQIVYVTYSVHPKSMGIVTLKWYTNSLLYKTVTNPPISDTKNGYSTVQFTQPVEGKVEIYWNDQLAITLYFVVRSASDPGVSIPNGPGGLVSHSGYYTL